MSNAANNSPSRRALKLGALLFLAVAICLPLDLSAQSLRLRGDQDISLQQIRVQDFNAGMGANAQQTQSLTNQTASITSIQGGSIIANLNTNFGNLNLVFVREVNNAWAADQFSGCPIDVDVQVTFQNGVMISTLNPSNSSSVIVESFDIDKKYKGNGCLNKASGSLRLYVDIGDAAAAGSYAGSMTIAVNPIY